MLKGHSGSNLEKHGNIVEKDSSYLANCSDRKARAEFMIKLTSTFQHAPKILEVNGSTIKYEFVTGEPGFEKVNLKELGKVTRELHSLKIPGPEKETGIQWLKGLADNNLAMHNVELDLTDLVAELSDEPKVIVHGEIADLIIGPNTEVTILDWDEAGLGSRYQDIGYIYFKCQELRNGNEDFEKFIEGYNDVYLDQDKIRRVAGLIAIAYSHWANSEYRFKLGLSLLV